jgi:hypothetical protein
MLTCTISRFIHGIAFFKRRENCVTILQAHSHKHFPDQGPFSGKRHLAVPSADVATYILFVELIQLLPGHSWLAQGSRTEPVCLIRRLWDERLVNDPSRSFLWHFSHLTKRIPKSWYSDSGIWATATPLVHGQLWATFQLPMKPHVHSVCELDYIILKVLKNPTNSASSTI